VKIQNEKILRGRKYEYPHISSKTLARQSRGEVGRAGREREREERERRDRGREREARERERERDRQRRGEREREREGDTQTHTNAHALSLSLSLSLSLFPFLSLSLPLSLSLSLTHTCVCVCRDNAVPCTPQDTSVVIHARNPLISSTSASICMVSGICLMALWCEKIYVYLGTKIHWYRYIGTQILSIGA